MLYSLVKQLRRRHGHPPLGRGLRRLGLPALLAVSDQVCSPGSRTTTRPESRRLDRRRPLRLHVARVLLLSVAALVVYHELGARLGLVTGKGLVSLIRSSYGTRTAAAAAVATLVVANLGTTCAEFAGVAAGLELAGISRYLSVPAAAVLVGFVVLRGSFHRIEHVLLLLSAVFITYVGAAFLAHPDWAEAGRGLTPGAERG